MFQLHKVKEKRLNKGWTQSKLAEKSGVPQPTISHIENGTLKNPSIKSIKNIASALGINLEELL
ncbi:helix-turn-helix transcriptional regulator [Bacillus paranthracis]|uniref:Transcriptional regulator n=1 Tax=Bacillus wiedmannii TaxID=1890302 RepID=A0A242YYJ3_9BACI|nr:MULTISPECIES: helix-turn-helix transcriptional regulator [Bacillus cereus group]MBG9749611.1 transcriptional regulator [Bacillus thuringiensis]MBG9782054.1 transcriptional regulator [Bacillus thuringiensis]MDR4137563.1 helix-turn-helix transcriptional regulator [Bacillus cereus]MDR4367753.1 helix-turn-helix transcriptional regulator [Bacillus cereus]NKX27881.1 helix-turn-helix transcriptional regulator [Bacillus paranthracis]